MLVDEETARRRTWSQEDKCRIVAETLEPGTSVAEVARRHNMNANMLFNWLSEAREDRLPEGSSQKQTGAGRERLARLKKAAGPETSRSPQPR